MLPITYKQLKQIMILRACTLKNSKKLKKATSKWQRTWLIKNKNNKRNKKEKMTSKKNQPNWYKNAR